MGRVLHLFSGPRGRPDGLAAELAKLGVGCHEIDIVNGVEFNLANDAAWLRLCRQLAAGEVSAVVAGPPCTTFSRARQGPPGPRPLRSAAHPYGLPSGELTKAEHEAVREGTYMALRTLAFLGEAHGIDVPFMLESPEPTPGVVSIFDLPEARTLAARPGVRAIDFDQCEGGGPAPNQPDF